MKKISVVLMTVAICFGIVNAVRAKLSGTYDQLYKDKPVAKVYHSKTPVMLVSGNQRADSVPQTVSTASPNNTVPEKSMTMSETYKLRQKQLAESNNVPAALPLTGAEVVTSEMVTIPENNEQIDSNAETAVLEEVIPTVENTDSIDNGVQFDPEMFSRAIPEHHVKKKKHHQEDIGLAMKEIKK